MRAEIAVNWVCYILRCADDTLYTGISNDLEKRLAAHNAGTAAKYTRARGPVQLVFVEPCADKSSALKREIAIKKLSRAQKIHLITPSLMEQLVEQLAISLRQQAAK
jgi:putative endonuclease